MSTISMRRALGVVAVLSGALVLSAAGTVFSGSAAADAVADFYKGKTVTILSGFGAGGMYGLYSRVIIPHMSRHIPGQPTMIAQFMPGAGGVKAANYFANVAAKDGTVLGLLSQSIALTQVLRGGTTIRYDAAKMHWIGSFDSVTNVMSVWNATTKIRRFADLKTTELIVGAPGKGSIGYMNMIMTQRVLGAKLKIIAGYARVEDLDLAFERGEVAGRAATFISIITRKQDWIAGNKVTHLVQFGLKRHPSYPDVPLAQDLTDDPEAKRMMRFVASPGTIGRGVSLPPGTPADRVAAMRAAFDATVADPAFLAEARGRKLPINHASAQEVTEAIMETVAAPKAMVARVAEIIAGK
jgi:tripartite-type tricarboxylate transporter receptor subunit TctC